MPELDDLLADRLEQVIEHGELGEMELAATLAAAYASPESTIVCQSVRRQSRLDLRSASRVARLPRAARPDRRCAAGESGTRCPGHDGLLCECIDRRAPCLHMSPELERIAIQRLNDKDPRVAANAIAICETTAPKLPSRLCGGNLSSGMTRGKTALVRSRSLLVVSTPIPRSFSREQLSTRSPTPGIGSPARRS